MERTRNKKKIGFGQADNSDENTSSQQAQDIDIDFQTAIRMATDYTRGKKITTECAVCGSIECDHPERRVSTKGGEVQ